MEQRPDFDEDPSFLEEKEETSQPEGNFSTPVIESDVLALMHIGSIEQQYDWSGHTFTLRTPKAGGELAIAQIVNNYDGPMAQSRALAVAEIAAALQLVDSREIYAPIEREEHQLTIIRRKFDYILDRWHWPVVELLHGFWKDLQVRQIEAMSELEGKSSAGRQES